MTAKNTRTRGAEPARTQPTPEDRRERLVDLLVRCCELADKLRDFACDVDDAMTTHVIEPDAARSLANMLRSAATDLDDNRPRLA